MAGAATGEDTAAAAAGAMESRDGDRASAQRIAPREEGPDPPGASSVTAAAAPVAPEAATGCCTEGGKRHRQGINDSSSSAAINMSRDGKQRLQQKEASPPPEAAMPAPQVVARGCCHRRHPHHLHRRSCCGAHCRGSHQGREDCNNPTSSGSCRAIRRRCGCRIGEYIFLLIPRKPLSPGAAFLFSLLQEESPSFRCAVDMGGTLAKLVFIEEVGPHSAAAAAQAAAAAAAVSDTGFTRQDPQLTARAYASNCDAALDLASPLLTIRGQPVFASLRLSLSFTVSLHRSPSLSLFVSPCLSLSFVFSVCLSAAAKAAGARDLYAAACLGVKGLWFRV